MTGNLRKDDLENGNQFSSGAALSGARAPTVGTLFADRGFRDAMAGGEHTTIEDDFLTLYWGDDVSQDGANFAEVYGPNQEANAAHIVRCVNERDELIAALQASRHALMIAGPGPSRWHSVWDEALTKIDAALAKAQSK